MNRSILAWYTPTTSIVIGVLFFGALVLAWVVGRMAGIFLEEHGRLEHGRLDGYLQWVDGNKDVLTICIAILSTVIAMQALVGPMTFAWSICLGMWVVCLLELFFFLSLRPYIQSIYDRLKKDDF